MPVTGNAKIEGRLAACEDAIRSPRLRDMSGSELLSLSSKFAKVEDAYCEKHAGRLIRKKVAVVGSTTTFHLIQILKLFFYQQGISPSFWEGAYGGIHMELTNPSSQIFAFKPDLLLILPFHFDIKEYPPLFSDRGDVEAWVDQKTSYYKTLWGSVSSLEGCQIFQLLFVKPLERHLGNLDVNYPFSPSHCLTRLNLQLVENRPPHVTLIDMDYWASLVGKWNWFDEPNYFVSKQGFSLDFAGRVAHQIARSYAAHMGRVRKCLVVDLDNTLWGGVVGDDGLEGIILDPNHAVGEAFLAFQKYIRKLKERGVILAVCSKNDEETARATFAQHPDMHLRLDDIACFVANWDDKVTNLRRIAEQLNIGLDSLVFVDDNPAERELVRQFAPDVEVIDLPRDPALYVRALDQALSFEWGQLVEEDVSRSRTYITNHQRAQLQAQAVNYDDYLKSLSMSAVVGAVGPMDIPRFSQLINKSNQFNLRTRRYPESAIEQMRASPEKWALIHISLKDRFDNYGIISSLILEKRGDEAFIDTLVMSCRVLKRGVEQLAFNALLEAARSWRCVFLIGEFIPTKKNDMVGPLLPSFGFRAYNGHRDKTEPSALLYHMDISSADPLPHWITVGKRRE